MTELLISVYIFSVAVQFRKLRVPARGLRKKKAESPLPHWRRQTSNMWLGPSSSVTELLISVSICSVAVQFRKLRVPARGLRKKKAESPLPHWRRQTSNMWLGPSSSVTELLISVSICSVAVQQAEGARARGESREPPFALEKPDLVWADPASRQRQTLISSPSPSYRGGGWVGGGGGAATGRLPLPSCPHPLPALSFSALYKLIPLTLEAGHTY